ncbi:carbohydrate kinase family protein [Gammaproteobacteria bacterium]|nr:carbohydrate kinase family protein [Gammaproteobacteria bacterium]
MKVLVTGSIAYDTIMVYPGHFRDHVMMDKTHILNLSFVVPEIRREFGGTSGNIAYNLKRLGAEPRVLTPVGHGFDDYARWFESIGIDTQTMPRHENLQTATCFLTTDLDDNQINAFHPGALDCTPQLDLSDEARACDIAILAATNPPGMIVHAEQIKAAGTPMVFDPGQMLAAFDKDALERFVELADYIVVNDYESHLLEQRVGLSHVELASRVKALIMTRGAKGSEIIADGQTYQIPAAPIGKAVDPTGCGDAYRAGILWGIHHQLPWEVSGRMAALLGAIKIEHPGTQNHNFTAQDFLARYQAAFGEALVGWV